VADPGGNPVMPPNPAMELTAGGVGEGKEGEGEERGSRGGKGRSPNWGVWIRQCGQ